MGGLQKKLIHRSYGIFGRAELKPKNHSLPFARQVLSFLKDKEIKSFAEYEIELLVKGDRKLSPAVVHGILIQPDLPEFLDVFSLGGRPGSLVGHDLLYRIGGELDGEIKLISPSHTNSVFGEEIPRHVSDNVYDILTSYVAEADSYHVWTRASLIWNLIRAEKINRIQIVSEFDEEVLREELNKKFGDQIVLRMWEEKNESLVFALRLETVVMVFLFMAMSFLVAIAITSGFMIFFDKIKLDLVSFWILGQSKKNLLKSSMVFLYGQGFVAVVLGLLLGYGSLFLLDHYAPPIMPDIFVDQRIPVDITVRGVLISFVVPYLISVLFSSLCLLNFKRDQSRYLDHVRTVA